MKDSRGNHLRAAGYEGESLYEAIKRMRIEISGRSLIDLGSCLGGPANYNLIERPIEPQADQPLCRECHVVRYE